MNESEIDKVVTETIASLNASGPSDMGKVMGAVMAKVGSSADGNMVSQIVKNKLS